MCMCVCVLKREDNYGGKQQNSVCVILTASTAVSVGNVHDSSSTN